MAAFRFVRHPPNLKFRNLNLYTYSSTFFSFYQCDSLLTEGQVPCWSAPWNVLNLEDSHNKSSVGLV
jgi:hypothetical protein